MPTEQEMREKVATSLVERVQAKPDLATSFARELAELWPMDCISDYVDRLDRGEITV